MLQNGILDFVFRWSKSSEILILISIFCTVLLQNCQCHPYYKRFVSCTWYSDPVFIYRSARCALKTNRKKRPCSLIFCIKPS